MVGIISDSINISLGSFGRRNGKRREFETNRELVMGLPPAEGRWTRWVLSRGAYRCRVARPILRPSDGPMMQLHDTCGVDATFNMSSEAKNVRNAPSPVT